MKHGIVLVHRCPLSLALQTTQLECRRAANCRTLRGHVRKSKGTRSGCSPLRLLSAAFFLLGVGIDDE